MPISLNQILKATQLTRSGRLMDATRLIQRSLGQTATTQGDAASGDYADTGAAPRHGATTANRTFADPAAVDDVAFRDIAPPVTATPPAPPSANDMRFDSSATEAGPALTPAPPIDAAAESSVAAPPTSPPTAPLQPASFLAHQFKFNGVEFAYRLYVPTGAGVRPSTNRAIPDGSSANPGVAPIEASATQSAPALIVLLHGCKQDAADFAKGTAMNALAEDNNCLVLYPEQLRQSNSMGCWNWFEPAHQSRDAGEPAMIAALTRQVIARHGVDAKRVYVAGLSAGGAMAALMAGLYPDLFAAAGVHSGLAAGAANDVMSAFTAMRRGPVAASGIRGKLSKSSANTPPVPIIVFHGTADKTVNPNNGEQIKQAAVAAFAADAQALTETQTEVADAVGSGAGNASRGTTRKSTRSIFRASDGRTFVEYWAIDAGPHAWSGGDAEGSYTDPDGPSASKAMLAFFLQHRLGE